MNEGEITERVEPTRFALKANDDGGWFINEFDLKPVGRRRHRGLVHADVPEDEGHQGDRWRRSCSRSSGKPDIHKRLDLLKEKAEAG